MHSMMGTCRLATLLAIALPFLLPVRVEAAEWTWSLSGDGFGAAGTFTTTDVPDVNGFVQITGITGSRDGVAIVGLQPVGTAVPGNDGFPVDDLLRAVGTQLTGAGFAFALADGTYSNPFATDQQPTSGYREFFSFPPFDPTSQAERPITFAATPVPEPASLILFGTGLLGLASIGVAGVRQGRQ